LLEEAQRKVYTVLGGQAHLLQRTYANKQPDAIYGIQTFNTLESSLPLYNTQDTQPCEHTAEVTGPQVSL